MFKKEAHMAHSAQGSETIIAQGVKVEGDFSSDGNVLIDGEVVGSIKTAQNLQIGQTARIHASVTAATALIAGEILGDLEATERLELTATSKVRGNITTAVLSVEPGAEINGTITMSGPESSKRGGRRASTEEYSEEQVG